MVFSVFVIMVLRYKKQCLISHFQKIPRCVLHPSRAFCIAYGVPYLTYDPWQQWQAFAALFTPGAGTARAAPGPASAASFAPFTEIAERFAAAARAYLEAAKAPAAAPADAAQLFSRLSARTVRRLSAVECGDARGCRPGRCTAGIHREFRGARRDPRASAAGQRMADAWRRIEEAQRRLQRLGSDALREAAADFATRLGASPPVDSPEALRKLYDMWIDCAEEAYGRAAHSEAFCNALAELVNASSDWRRELQASIEHWAKFFDLPTRSEINTLLQRLKTVEEKCAY